MKFNWVILNVNDIDESMKFYTEIIGLRVCKKIQEFGADIVFLGDGETKLELICDKEHPNKNMGQDVSLGFAVKSVYEMMEILNEHGATIQTGSIEPNPHIKYFYAKDPNGVRIQFSETAYDIK
jgi:lactoylglutathione lyase